MEKNQNKIKMIDNFVRKYTLDLSNRMPSTEVAKYNANVGFSIKKIVDGNNNDYIGQIMLSNKLDITSERTTGVLYIEMEGLFSGSKSWKKDEFEKKLKIEGATILNHYMRTYIHAVTSLSSMPTINTPVIDFEEFFDNADKKKNFKLITNDNNIKE
ncbi:MAG: hypothetical protein HFJ43_03635 [Clostridia bacterium]|nr:hypothetical protein [Clostridia bacterium]